MLEVGPGDGDRPPDLSQTCSLTSEPAGYPEDGSRLRAVFDALDGDGDGFVRIEDFVQFATVYGAEQVKDLTKYLDPSGLGVISFEDFYQGITAIRNGDSDSQLCGVASAQDEEPQACPDEFEDFVTFEASGFYGRAEREFDVIPPPLCSLSPTSLSGPWTVYTGNGLKGRAGLTLQLCTHCEGHCGLWALGSGGSRPQQAVYAKH
ncbi:Rab11 family-interacting protein 3 [Pteropus alecto]|uniref:Rab11 family-interacting protein 3 n=1 Tax=Pteropus alecto TaxID=9402 RepID=L5KH44_PTEAL|nr:Rab11 family-interacting protein 3 [Pteropus alecto]